MLRVLLFSSAAILGAGLPALANAQAAGEPADTKAQSSALSEVVVTARRRAEDASRVPISISAFSQQTLERKGVLQVQDLAKITPGLNMTPGGSRSNPFITIRGQTKGITGNINPGVISYVNEVPLTNYGANLPTYDVSNIQVLKGPQGTLFGRNAMGGAILTYTNPPSHTFGGYAKAELGSYDFTQFEGAVNIPIVQDKVAVRFATQIYHEGGSFETQLVKDYTINPVTGIATSGQIVPAKHDIDELKSWNFRGSLLLEPTDWLKNVTVYEHTKIRGSVNGRAVQFYPQGYLGSAPAPYFLSPATLLSRFGPVLGQNIINLSQCGYSVACDWRLAEQFYSQGNGREIMVNIDPWLARTITWSFTNTTTVNINDNTTLKNIFAYRDVDSFNVTDSDGTPLVIVNAPGQVRLHTYTEELQLSGDLFDNKLKYTFGGFYYNEAPDGPGGQFGGEVNSLFGLSHNYAYTYLHNKSKALYGQIDYSLDDFVKGLTVTGGLRQTWDSVSGCAGSVTINSNGPAVVFTGPHPRYMVAEDRCEANNVTPAMIPFARTVVNQKLPKEKFNKLTYTVGANWQVTPDIMIYGTHRRGYRAGSYNTPLFDPQFLGQIQTFQPETIEDFEIGTKTRWNVGGIRGSFDLAAFTGKDKNYQLALATNSLAGGICTPQAITPTRPANCTNALLGGVPGVTISHAPSTTVVNAGEVTIRGFEADASIMPIDGLTIGLGLAHLDYKVNEVGIDPNMLALLRASGQNPPTTIVLTQQPRWTYNLSADYVYPDKILGSEVSLNVNYKHSDKFVATAGGVEAPDFDVWDARLTFSDVAGSGVDVSAYIKNITNNYYAAYVSSGAPQSLGEVSWNVAQPRLYGVSVKYTFGN
jgi:iron complex outermembrane recepter protein